MNYVLLIKYVGSLHKNSAHTSLSVKSSLPLNLNPRYKIEYRTTVKENSKLGFVLFFNKKSPVPPDSNVK